MKKPIYQFFKCDRKKVAASIGKEGLLGYLRSMLLIRNFEQRGEAAYQQGKVGGFYHSYAGQEAIQTACIGAAGRDNWYTTTYRCHAMALLLGVTPNEAMAELYGRVTGIAKGRGGSMHMYAPNMLGGLAIVGGHIPIATGAAFTVKYLEEKKVSFCFMGEGAVVQGAFHESLNLAALWKLPCIYVIENNQWGMGTSAQRAVAVQPIGEHFAKAFDMECYTLDGMDFLSCYAAFQEIRDKVLKNSKPILVEAITERFRGHSISDPALYRSKEDLQECMKRDPILLLKEFLIEEGFLTEEAFKEMDKEEKERVIAAMKFADESPYPDLVTLEEDVFGPMEGI